MICCCCCFSFCFVFGGKWEFLGALEGKGGTSGREDLSGVRPLGKASWQKWALKCLALWKGAELKRIRNRPQLVQGCSWGSGCRSQPSECLVITGPLPLAPSFLPGPASWVGVATIPSLQGSKQIGSLTCQLVVLSFGGSTSLEAESLGFKFWICPFLVVWSWVDSLISPEPQFPCL